MSTRFDLLGFVSLQDIQYVFTTELTKIDENIRRNGAPQNHRIIIEWIDDLRASLSKRAKYNLAAYLANNPDFKAQVRDNKAAESAQASSLTAKERIAKNRERALKGEA